MFFVPASSDYFLSDFPLVPPLKNFKKWPILVSLRNWPLLGIASTFRAAGTFRAAVWQGVFGACEFCLLFERFSLGPLLEEFQKMADFGVFAKLAIARICRHF